MNEQPGFLIELEGGDGAGKRTQTERLRRRLTEAGWEVLVYSFPDDGTPYGRVIRTGLNGEYGDFRNTNPYLTAPLYMADRAFRAPEIVAALARRAIVLLDRGPYSNFAYQGAKIPGRSDRDDFQAWCEQMEFNELSFPRPDLVLFLNVPTDVAAGLVDRRGAARDQHESDAEFQRAVHYEFLHLDSKHGWYMINCGGEGATLASPDVIHERIWRVVHRFLAERG